MVQRHNKFKFVGIWKNKHDPEKEIYNILTIVTINRIWYGINTNSQQYADL